MRLSLITLHIVVVGILITSIFAICALALNSSTPQIDDVFTVAGFLAALQTLSMLLGSKAMIGAELWTMLSPFFTAFACSAACAVLAGYPYLRLLKWIGFLINIVLAILFGIISVDTQDYWIFTIVSFYATCAVLFARIPLWPDAERTRRPLLFVLALFWIAGVWSAWHFSGSLGIFSSFLYTIFFLMHLWVVGKFKIQIKSVALLILVLGTSILCVAVLLFTSALLVAPLLVSTLTVFWFAESMFLSWKKTA